MKASELLTVAALAAFAVVLGFAAGYHAHSDRVPPPEYTAPEVLEIRAGYLKECMARGHSLRACYDELRQDMAKLAP